MKRQENENKTASLGGGGANNTTSSRDLLGGGGSRSNATSLSRETLEGGVTGSNATSSQVIRVYPSISEEDDLLKSDGEVKLTPTSGSSKDLGSKGRHSTPKPKDEEASSKVRVDEPSKGSGGRHGWKKMSAGNIRREDLRNARFYLRRHDESIANERALSSKDKDHYEWAIKTLKKYETLDEGESSSSKKRDRSMDLSGRGDEKKFRVGEKSSGSRYASSRHEEDKRKQRLKESSREAKPGKAEGKPSAKSKETDRRGRLDKVKHLDNVPLNEILKQDLKVCMVDKSAVDLRIDGDNYSRVERAVFDALVKWVEMHPSSPAPVFSSNERFRGYRVITCDSLSSVEFLREAVSKLPNLWKDAQLTVMLLREIPALPKAFINIPLSVDDKQVGVEFGSQALSVLRAQNPSVPIINWKLLRVGKIQRRVVLLTFAIDRESLTALSDKGHKVSFCMGERKVVTSKGGLNTEECEKEESILEEMMEKAQIDDPLGDDPHI
ncbi:isoform c [Lasius niger]|uniref:Isoform c n=1 Tax=Lasius niger TaxID=67767 RepID=A0A0J7N418_LASNI|nr:isoform c [Lasius niger]